ncbi:MAG: hypothetical protein ACRDTT_24490 [Pseudonocardiaceae bacterium]
MRVDGAAQFARRAVKAMVAGRAIAACSPTVRRARWHYRAML